MVKPIEIKFDVVSMDFSLSFGEIDDTVFELSTVCNGKLETILSTIDNIWSLKEETAPYSLLSFTVTSLPDNSYQIDATARRYAHKDATLSEMLQLVTNDFARWF